MNDMFLMTFDCFSNMPAGLTACDISTAPPFPTEPDRPGGLSFAPALMTFLNNFVFASDNAHWD